jgi:hypothetical protein
MAKDVTVRITKEADPSKCKVDPRKFVTSPGKDADIIFRNGSPFDPRTSIKPNPLTFRPGQHKVIADVPAGSDPLTFNFDVEWSGGAGKGNGSGEIIPS